MKHRKIDALESIRGLAAVIVLFWHYLNTFSPASTFGSGFIVRSPLELIIFKSPLGAFISGGFAVGIFFVLSGFVLSLAYFRYGDLAKLQAAAAKRYFRLMPPVFVSVLIGFVALALGLFKTYPLTQQITGTNVTFWQFSPSPANAILQGTVRSFLFGHAYYNPVIWTMQIEFLGSFLVFATLALFGKSPFRVAIYAVLFYALSLTSVIGIVGFIVGMVLADVVVNRHDVLPLRLLNRWYVALPILLVALVIAAYPTAGGTEQTLYRFIAVPGYSDFGSGSLWHTAAGALVIMVALQWAPFQAWLSRPALIYLGRISFSLYLVHFIILFAFTCPLFNWLFGQTGQYGLSFLLAAGVSLPFTFIVAQVFQRQVDQRALQLAQAVGDYQLATTRPVFLPYCFTRMKQVLRNQQA